MSEPPPAPSVRIVIVNYRSAGLTLDCLRSLESEVGALPDCRVTVVEGGSADGSADTLRSAIRNEGWGGWVELVPLAENRGFAAGNNAALRERLNAVAPPEYVLLLNPDTVVRPGAVAALVEFMDANPAVGIAGSRLEDPDGTSQRSAFRFPGVASEFEAGVRLGPVSRLLRRVLVAPPVRDDRHPTDWVAGASMIVRRRVFEDIGLLDDGYFLYFEETDFCLRAKRAGWPTWYVPDSRVVHLVGQSSGVTDPKRPPPRMPAYWFESRRRYFRRNHGRLYARAADVAWVVGFGLWRVRAWVQRKPDPGPSRLLWDFVRFNFLPASPHRRSG
jgi:N-acetylglucosaminyl-diphospho-decaprenol L-rhamnosyltransferase